MSYRMIPKADEKGMERLRKIILTILDESSGWMSQLDIARCNRELWSDFQRGCIRRALKSLVANSEILSQKKMRRSPNLTVGPNRPYEVLAYQKNPDYLQEN